MKNKYSVNDSVITPTTTGTIKQAAPFTDHVEYMVEFADKTASWIHEKDLQPSDSKPATATATPK